MSKLLIHEPPLQVLPSLAVEFGLNEAIVIQQLHYWLENPKVGVTKDGVKWVSNSYEEWKDNFPFWSISTIKRIFSGLEEKNIVLSIKFEAEDWNQRKSYRLNYELLDEVNLTQSNRSNRDSLNRNSETTTENKESLKTDETKGKYQLQGIEAAMFGDRPVTEQDLPVWEKREKDAISAFESALGIPANWNWYPAKSTEEPTWRDFRKFLVEKYEADPQAFTRYNTWRNQPYVRGAMSNTDIKRFPGNFPTSWSDFEGTAKSEKDEPPLRML